MVRQLKYYYLLFNLFFIIITPRINLFGQYSFYSIITKGYVIDTNKIDDAVIDLFTEPDSDTISSANEKLTSDTNTESTKNFDDRIAALIRNPFVQLFLLLSAIVSFLAIIGYLRKLISSIKMLFQNLKSNLRRYANRRQEKRKFKKDSLSPKQVDIIKQIGNGIKLKNKIRLNCVNEINVINQNIEKLKELGILKGNKNNVELTHFGKKIYNENY